MNNKSGISYKNKTILILSLFIIPYLICLLSYNIYTVNIVINRNISQENISKIRMYSTFFENTLSDIDIFMSKIVANDTDFKVLCYSVSELNAYLSSYQILAKCKDALSIHDIATGFFVYAPKNKLYRNIFNQNAKVADRQKLVDEMQTVIKNSNTMISKWFVQKIDSENYLVRIFGYNETYLVCIINLNNAVYLSNLYNTLDENVFLLVSDNMQLLTTNAVLENDKNDIKLKRDNKPYLITVGKRRYQVLQHFSDLSGILMVYLVPHQSIWNNMDTIQISLLVTSIFCIILVPVCYFLFKRTFFSPLKEFVNTMNSIKEGNLDVSMNNQSSIREFKQMSNTFNEMLNEIKSLKIVAYEQTLEAQRATMQFLRIQIRPHFYLNCLNNIYALAQSENYNQIQKMIIILSEYLRNMFQESPYFVPLSAEMNNVEAYVELQRMTKELNIIFDTDIDNKLMNFMIPPLTILTFVENSLKFAVSLKKDLIIHVVVRMFENYDENYVNISIRDNGRGFPEEELKRLNSEKIVENSHHVGIANVKQRFLYQYRGKATISFFNSNGACVEIFIPKSKALGNEVL